MKILVVVALVCAAVSAELPDVCDNIATGLGLESPKIFKKYGLTKAEEKCNFILVTKIAKKVFSDNECGTQFKKMVCPGVLAMMAEKQVNQEEKENLETEAYQMAEDMMDTFLGRTTEGKMQKVCSVADCAKNVYQNLLELFHEDDAAAECAKSLLYADGAYDNLVAYLESQDYEVADGENAFDWNVANDFILRKIKSDGYTDEEMYATAVEWFESGEAERVIGDFFKNVDKVCEAGCVSETASYIDTFIQTADESKCEYLDICSCGEVKTMVKETNFPCCVNEVVTFYEKKIDISDEVVEEVLDVADKVYDGARKQISCMQDMYYSRKVDQCPAEESA